MRWVRLLGFIFVMLLVCSQAVAQQAACSFESNVLAFDEGLLLGSDSGDLDGDGDYDIIVFRGGGIEPEPREMVVLKNDGVGQFSFFSSFEPPMLGIDSPNPKLGDLDGDGDLDVVFEAFNNELMYLYFNDGTGIFGDEQIIQHPNRNISANVADLDGDGDLDIVIPVEPIFLYIYFNDGLGNFSDPTIFTPGNTAGRPALRDFDNDSDIDIVVNATSENDIVAYLNDGTGSFGPELVSDNNGGSGRINVADFNQDGILDLILVFFGSRVMYGNGDGTFQPPLDLVTGGLFRPTVGLLDVDNDSDLDLILNEAFEDTTRLFFNNGDGTLTEDFSISFGFSPNVPLVRDFDGDGKLDVSISHSEGIQATLYLECREVLFGDINQNGEVNLLDVQPFIDLLSTGDYLLEADIQRDNSVDLLDVSGFIQILNGS